MEAHIQATTVRNHLHRVTKRVEAELGEEQFSFIDTCKRDLASLPKALYTHYGWNRWRLC